MPERRQCGGEQTLRRGEAKVGFVPEGDIHDIPQCAARVAVIRAIEGAPERSDFRPLIGHSARIGLKNCVRPIRLGIGILKRGFPANSVNGSFILYLSASYDSWGNLRSVASECKWG